MVISHAFAANAVNCDISVFNPAPAADFFRQAHIIQRLPLEVGDLVAFSAGEVVVAHYFELEPGLAFHGLDLVDQSMTGKGCQCAINRIQRDCRDLYLYAMMNRLGGWVIDRNGQFGKYLQSLVGQPQARLPACSSKRGELSPGVFHIRLPVRTFEDFEVKYLDKNDT